MTHGCTAAWVAQQAAKATCPVKEGWSNGALSIFVSGTPKHYKGKGNRYTVSAHTKDWRERTAMRLYEYSPFPSIGRVVGRVSAPWPWQPTDPKSITFTVYTSGRGFDGPDNIRLVCSPCLDALGPRRPRGPGMGLIDDDKNPAHAIEYLQVTKAPVPGIAVRIALRDVRRVVAP